MLVCTIPLAPFLTGRGNNKKRRKLWRHILHSSCQRGCTPLDFPLGTPTTVGVPPCGYPPASPGACIPSRTPFLSTPTTVGVHNKKRRKLWRYIPPAVRAHQPPSAPSCQEGGKLVKKKVMEAHPPSLLPKGMRFAALPLRRVAHPPFFLPMGLRPSGLPLRRVAHPPFLLPVGMHPSALPLNTCWGAPQGPCQRAALRWRAPTLRARAAYDSSLARGRW